MEAQGQNEITDNGKEKEEETLLPNQILNETVKETVKQTMQEEMTKAKQMIEMEKQMRVERCRIKIQKALEEENCILDSQTIITSRGVNATVVIMAKIEG